MSLGAVLSFLLRYGLGLTKARNSLLAFSDALAPLQARPALSFTQHHLIAGSLRTAAPLSLRCLFLISFFCWELFAFSRHYR